MQNFPKVFVIVLNYNGIATIKACLDSIFKSNYPNFEVIVVDNASRDGSFELAKRCFSRAHFILNGKNIGFAAGNNVAIRFALEKMADYAMLLNNDAEIEKDALQELVKTGESKSDAGILSPLIFKGRSDEIWFAGGKIKWLAMKADHFTTPLSENPYKIQYVTGCAMLIKKDVFKKIGLLDENYFLYYEDADFCWRAKKEGFKSYIVPSVKVYHFEKSEENKKAKTYWLVISGLIFFKKNAPVILKLWIVFYTMLRKIKNWRDVRFGKNELAKIVQKAYRDYNVSRQIEIL